MTDTMLVQVAVFLAWLAWTWLVLCLAVEVVARAKGGGVAARLPASRHAQTIAALLVGATMALVPTARMHATTRLAAVGTTRPIYQATLVADHMASNEGAFQPPGSGCTTAEAIRTSHPASAASIDPEYVVEPGDTMWSIAGKELGSPLRWREIAALNLGRVQSDGDELSRAGFILPG